MVFLTNLPEKAKGKIGMNNICKFYRKHALHKELKKK